MGFVVYGGASRKDWRTVTLKDVKADLNDVSNQLIPMLQSDRAPEKKQTRIWTKKLIDDCRRLAAKILPLRSNELEFRDRLNGAGEITPELLTDDAAMQATISVHPALQWKAQNVREYRKSKQ